MNIRLVLPVCLIFVSAPSYAAKPVDYVSEVKPILAKRCYTCHSALRQQGGLRLDTAALMIEGGDSGAAIVPGKAAESYLIDMLTGESGSRMPPEEEGAPLTAEQIALIKTWIDQGAKAPEEVPLADPRDHWAYQVPTRPAIPQVNNADWRRSAIDAFLAADHERLGLVPVGMAEKHVLLRRVYLDLIGLPPTREELNEFLADESSDAYEKVVDRLLESPRYGERWGRHWMDVWRYSDWSGYRNEIRNSQRHIWRWRDWIIQSLNADKPYDRMILEMLAGDELAPTDESVLPATGFLARNWYKFNRNTWLDNTIEHTAKAFLAVTMNCTRCHEHKYDPIDQVEYYRLRAIFEPHDVRTDRVPGETNLEKDGLPRICDLKMETPTYRFIRGNDKHPDKETPIEPGVPAVLGGAFQIEPVELPVEAYYPALRPWVVKEELDKAQQQIQAAEDAVKKSQSEVATAQAQADKLAAAKPATPDKKDAALAEVEKLLEKDQQSSQNAAQQKQPMPDKAAADAALAKAQAGLALAEKQLVSAKAQQAALAARIAADKAKYGLSADADAAKLAAEAGQAEREATLRSAEQQVLVAEQALAVAESALASADPKADKKKLEAAKTAAQKTLADAKKKLTAAQQAMAKPATTYTALGKAYPTQSSGRRLALARWIANVENPLTARVAVNHIWLRHFGAPLVDNMFDFGLRSKQIRNQPLLDWLAVELMENGWSMKHLHRLMVTSKAYRMKSSSDGDATANLAKDADNRYLWRMNSRRLEAELVRDSVLHVAGNLDLTMGGPEIDQNAGQTSRRRSVYFRHAYEKQMKFLELFDGASVNECYRRSESIIPQQALALSNSTLSLEQARLLARQLAEQTAKTDKPKDQFITTAFQHMLSRDPSTEELGECRRFLDEQAQRLADAKGLTPFAGGAASKVKPSSEPELRAKESLVHVLMNHNDFVTIR